MTWDFSCFAASHLCRLPFSPCVHGRYWGAPCSPWQPWDLFFLRYPYHTAPSQPESHSLGHLVPKSSFHIFFDSVSTLERKRSLFPFYRGKKKIEREDNDGEEHESLSSQGQAPCSNPSRSRMLAERGSSLHLTASNSSMAVWIC